MSLTNLTTKTPYAGNGVTTVFPFTFKVFQAADLVVTETTAAGVTTTLVLNTDYTVTGAGLDAGGSITRIGATSPPPTGTTGLIRRVVALTQTADIRNQSAFYASVHEDVFDKLTMADQQQEEEIGRAVQLPEEYSAGVSTQLPKPAAGAAIGWDPSASVLANLLVNAVPIGLPNGAASLDGSGLVPASQLAASHVPFTQTGAGAIAQTLDSKAKQILHASDWGAVLDNATDNTAVIQSMCNAAGVAGGGVVQIPRKCKWTPSSLTWVNNVDIVDDSTSDYRHIILNGGNAGGAVNEFEVQAGYHPAYILDVYNNRTLGTLVGGQVYSNRASFIYRVNGTGVWQIANDINAIEQNDLTFYRLGSSFQMLTLQADGKNTYGQMASGGLWSADYPHNFRGASFCFENSSGNLSFIFRLHDNSKRKIITYDTTADTLSIANTANTKNIWTLDDSGNMSNTGYFKQGVGASVASASTIAPTGPIFPVSGTTTISTISLPYPGFTGTIRIIPTGAVPFTTGGNIAKAFTATAGQQLDMTFDGSLWQPSYTTAAAASSAPGNPTGTTSTTPVMMGLAHTVTPTKTGRILVIVSGQMANSTVNDGVSVQLRVSNTGNQSVPANAAALTGTQYGNTQTHTSLVAADTAGFSISYTIAGLTPGQFYWVDLALAAVTGGTASVTGVSISTVEV